MIERIAVTNFRCFAGAQAALAPGITLFTGRNAQGKTSLLEAACILLRLSSPRTSRLAHAIRHGAEEEGFCIAGRAGGHRIEVLVSATRRQVLIDGAEPRDRSEFVSAERVVWFGNSDLQLACGPAELRRRYLDFLGAQLGGGYRRALAAYEQALRSRNRLLRQRNRDRRAIEAFTAPMIEAGNRLSGLRRAIAARLLKRFVPAYARLSGGEEAWLEYQPGGGEDFARRLAETSAQEERLGHTVAGPHRDDLGLTVGGRPAARFCSEGQQRSIAVALKLAQAELLGLGTDQPPVFLIDDIFGELDAARRVNLFNAIAAPGVQALVTSTGIANLAGLVPQRHYEVEAAQLTERK